MNGFNRSLNLTSSRGHWAPVNLWVNRASKPTIVKSSNRSPHERRNVCMHAEWGRNQRLGALGLASMIEVVATGGLFWAPLMAAILSAIVQQTNDEKRQFIREEVDRAVAIARTEALKRTPVTPAEPSQWLGMALTSVWDQYFAALVMHENLQSWQAKVQNAAPPGWSLELVSMSLGKEGPKLSNWQCFSSPDGRLLAVECKMEFISDTVKVVVKGSGPLGAFGATVSSLSVSGNIKLIPRPDQRIVLWAFKEPPSVLFKLQLSSGLSNAYDVPSFGFLRNALTDSIKSTMVEPRRAAISLDYEYLVQQALDTTITVFIESVQNLFPSPLSKPVVRPSSEDVAVWDSSDDEAVSTCN